ncbi:MAG TPA: YozE family protein [Eubacteriales bacterium]|nr:YozE family protein [Eubacteriales bacterium]
MKFITWLNKYKGTETPQADLLADIERDESFPKTNSKNKILNHLSFKNACSDCIRTFIISWHEYKSDLELEKMND